MSGLQVRACLDDPTKRNVYTCSLQFPYCAVARESDRPHTHNMHLTMINGICSMHCDAEEHQREVKPETARSRLPGARKARNGTYFVAARSTKEPSDIANNLCMCVVCGICCAQVPAGCARFYCGERQIVHMCASFAYN